jgi:hypothetical protein
MNEKFKADIEGEKIILKCNGYTVAEFISKEEIRDLVLKLSLASDSLFGPPSFYESRPYM